MTSRFFKGGSGLRSPEGIRRYPIRKRNFKRRIYSMLRYRLYAPLALGLLIAVVFQVVMIAGDCRKTPNDAVISFSEAYFMLNPDMADWLCEERKRAGDIDVVAYYLDTVAKAAKQRGYGRDYMKKRLSHIRTTVLREDDTSAEVRLTGLKRFGMNPLFELVGKIFGFTESMPVDEVISVVKEGNRWKICGNPYRFPVEI
jgi:hypothetical protein